MYVDVHCHLLPGVDDGVRDWEESRICLQRALDERISTVLLTPHIWPGRYPNRPGDLRAAFEEWRKRASAMGMDSGLGAEVYFSADLPERWSRGELLAMGGSGRYLLVELPLLLMPQGVARTFFDLRLLGVEPVLAHPERYPYAADNPRALEPLHSAAVPFQLTTHSVAGLFGRRIQKCAFAFLEMGWAGLLASDAHGAVQRAPLFREAVRVVAVRYGKEAARRLCIENPRRLIEGKELLPVRCEPRRRRRSP
jgi:protein-tyrosine phosphatase